MPPPPAEPLSSRIFLGPALRTQPDRRLVKLVREGYEGAFEEIVRNTALNDLRDAPPATEELGEAVAGGQSAAMEAERREEIAAALGVSGGAARQAIYRAGSGSSNSGSDDD